MAWKLTEVPDDDDEALSDWELLGVKVSLQASAHGETEDVAVFGAIWGKLWPYFARAINNEHRRNREESAI
jgi:ABC-type uncharacterized transport system YnjBCD substrate-binding protein